MKCLAQTGGSFPEKIKSTHWFFRGSDEGTKNILLCSCVHPNTESSFAHLRAMISLQEITFGVFKTPRIPIFRGASFVKALPRPKQLRGSEECSKHFPSSLMSEPPGNSDRFECKTGNDGWCPMHPEHTISSFSHVRSPTRPYSLGGACRKRGGNLSPYFIFYK